MNNNQSNLAKGRDSYDSTSTGLIAFFNKNVTPYATEVGSPSFAPVEVGKEKDIILNTGKLHAQQEYDRIMEQVEVLRRQADSLTNRMAVSERMHNVDYGIHVVHGKTYYVYLNKQKGTDWLSSIHPNNWCAGPGEHNEFVMAVKLMGDSSWEEVTLDETQI